MLETKGMEYLELKEFTEEERAVRTEIMEQMEADFAALQGELAQAQAAHEEALAEHARLQQQHTLELEEQHAAVQEERGQLQAELKAAQAEAERLNGAILMCKFGKRENGSTEYAPLIVMSPPSPRRACGTRVVTV